MAVSAPSYELTLGTQRWTEQLLALDVHVGAAPATNRLVARFPSGAAPSAAGGDPASLRLDSGEAAEEVFNGVIDTIEHDLRGLVISAIDAGGLLARYRPATTYEHVSAATLIRSLCSDVGAEVGEVDEGVQLRYFVADPTRNALEHIARLASWSDAIAGVDGKGKVTTRVVETTTPDIALRYGRDVLRLSEASAQRTMQTFAVAGESGVGSADDPDALRPSADFFAGNRPDGPGPDARWSFEGSLRTSEAAREAATGLARRYGARGERRTLTARLQPGARPGSVLGVDELPDRFGGSTYLTDAVWHHLSPVAVWTRLQLVKAGAGGSGSLLGSAIGALA